MGTKIKSHLPLLCFYVSCCLCFFAAENCTYDGYGGDFLFAPYVLLQTLVLIASQVLMQMTFFFFFFFFFFFSLFGRPFRAVFPFLRSAPSGAAFPGLRGESRDMKAECVRMMVRGKEGEEEEERGESRVPHHPSLPPSQSSHFNPAIHPDSFSETCWLTALMQCRLFFSLLDHVPLQTWTFFAVQCTVHTVPQVFFLFCSFMITNQGAIRGIYFQIQGFLSLLLRFYTLYTSSVNSITDITRCRSMIYDCDATKKICLLHISSYHKWWLSRCGTDWVESPPKAKHHGTDITDAKL